MFPPISLVSSLIAGLMSKRLFGLIWCAIDDEQAPEPRHAKVSYAKLVAALIIEGALVGLIRGLTDHAARRGYARLTGSWPGDPEPGEK